MECWKAIHAVGKKKKQVIMVIVEVAKQVALLNMVVSGSCIRMVSKLRK